MAADDLDPRDPQPTGLTRGPGGFRQSLGQAAARRFVPGHPIWLEAPAPELEQPRYGWGRPSSSSLHDLLMSRVDTYRATIEQIERHGPEVAKISREPAGGVEPYWNQSWWTGVDAAALYAFIRERRPRRYHEVGSGNSTLFAARAARDAGLDMWILSVDPQPRAAVDQVCDRVVRAPLQQADIAELTALDPGDVLLIDSSHYAFMNSDVVAVFLDIVPSLPAGILLGIHDIFLPDDYPWWMADRWYTEQYLLAAWLLGAGDRANVVLPTHFATTEPTIRAGLEAAWDRAGLSGILPYGTCFWLETGPA